MTSWLSRYIIFQIEKKIDRLEVYVNFCLVIFLFNQSKDSIVLEARTGHFQGLVGFEAKAKQGCRNKGGMGDRGGVEDTRLEAKAKDTKKIRSQGQGQPFRGQTLSRPRTGMLEAKAKDQGHKHKCSPKKKGLRKNFSSDLHKKTFSKKIFKRSTKF